MFASSPDFPSTFNIEFEFSPILANRHTVIAPRRFERNVAGTNVV